MADSSDSGFALFPLGLVALPHELVPLHIFEARYRVMVADCLEQGTEFGIIWSADDGLRDVGCAMEIADVLEELEDGRMNIITRGTRPFTLPKRSDALGYPSGTVEWLDDDDEDPTRARRRRPRRLPRAGAHRHRPRPRRGRCRPGRLPDGRHRRSSAPPQAELLELRNENDRLRMVATMFSEATARLQLIGRGIKARSNGKVSASAEPAQRGSPHTRRAMSRTNFAAR